MKFVNFMNLVKLEWYSIVVLSFVAHYEIGNYFQFQPNK